MQKFKLVYSIEDFQILLSKEPLMISCKTCSKSSRFKFEIKKIGWLSFSKLIFYFVLMANLITTTQSRASLSGNGGMG